ncbi:MAG: hypothetical protein NT001_01615, partial [Candidatus Woesearchaeota archaeon]|nr:hypothetical protein [Candidatus Woesearchaeota archaeon]
YGGSYLGIDNNSIDTNAREFGYGLHTSGVVNSSINYNKVVTRGQNAPAYFLEADNGNVIRGGNYTALHATAASTGLNIRLNANASFYDAIFNGNGTQDIIFYHDLQFTIRIIQAEPLPLP